MNQTSRDKVAIRTILRQMLSATYGDIALRGGEGLASPLMEMVAAGEVTRTLTDGVAKYALVDPTVDVD